MTTFMKTLPAALIFSAAAATAYANDSTAALGAGGLVLTENADIRMASEDLFVSREAVRVRYSFVNDSAAPITTRVAFPMPEADMAILSESDVGWPSKDMRNVIDFRIRVDGREVRPDLEEKAVLNGVDVTPILRKYRVPIDYAVHKTLDYVAKLPAAAKNDLVARKLIIVLPDYIQATWIVKNTFHWVQTFPAGRPLAVEHDYKPVVGGSFLPAGAFFELKGKALSDDYYKNFCIDAGTQAGIASRLRALQKRDGENAMLIQWVVDYVLTTGKNWKGAIGRFRLTVDKGQPDNVISFCMDGVRKSGPTTFVVERTNFEPDRDLSVMIFEPPVPSR
ncbi:MAG: DUF4424 domain-containing protein [Alphaproteobacteria bacterium]|nr:DUF4424 domain-containing protein [Alphaproteobacteria bacterium]